jgi:hypothetical protein
MYLQWDGERPLADREMIAELYGISQRTVRRYCTPDRYQRRRGEPPGQGGRALYDAYESADALASVVPRPDRTAAAQRIRRAKPASAA